MLAVDKLISVVCFILMIMDTIDLIETTISFSRKHSKQEIEDIHKNMNKAKEFLKKKLKEKGIENEGLPSVKEKIEKEKKNIKNIKKVP